MWPHELKLRHARAQFEELELEIDRWLHVDGCAIEVERQGERWFVVRAQRLRELDFESLALKVGDVLQNARASLDYLAHELGDIGAGWGGMTSEESEQSQFPIVSDIDNEGNSGLGLDRFRERVPSNLATLTPQAVAFIESEQPFQEGEMWDTHPLWTLQELARIDRHRFLHFAVVRSGNLRRDASKWSNAKILGRINVVSGPCYFGDDEAPEERVGEPENSAVLAKFEAVPTTPGKEMHMHFLDALTVGWDPETSPVRFDFEGVTDTLNSILLRVRKVFRNAQPHLVRPEPPDGQFF